MRTVSGRKRRNSDMGGPDAPAKAHLKSPRSDIIYVDLCEEEGGKMILGSGKPRKGAV